MLSPDMTDWFAQICESPPLDDLVRMSSEGGACSVRGAAGSSTHLIAASLCRRLERLILLVVAHLDDADEAMDEFEGLGLEAAKFPAMELAPGGSKVSLDVLAERLSLVKRLGEGDIPAIIVTPIQALMQAVPDATQLDQMFLVIRLGDAIDPVDFARWLDDAGYSRVVTIDAPGEFALRGDIIDIYSPESVPVRIDMFGNKVERMSEIDLDSMGSDRTLERVEIVGATVEQLQRDDSFVSLLEHMPGGAVAVLSEMTELTEQGRSYYDRAVDARGLIGPPSVFKSIGARCHSVIDVNQYSEGTMPTRRVELPVQMLPGFEEETTQAIVQLHELAREHSTVVLCQNEGEKSRLTELLEEIDVSITPKPHVTVITHYLHRGLIWTGPDLTSAGRKSLALVPYHELLNRYLTRRRVRRMSGGRAMDSFVDLQPGDIVVHRDHGIARFLGLQTLEKNGEEYLTLEFSGRSKLHVPSSHIEKVQKYIGAFKGAPKLSTLGGKGWKRQKEKVSEAVRDLAGEMLRIQAARESMPGIRYPVDTVWQYEFEAEFPYEETEDQLTAIAAMKKDMNDPRPMDRLICGDVGFGKTEIAIRGAFKAVEYGKQVAVLVPTTVLAEQHERTFRERFADYPFRIESLSRFKTVKESKETLLAIAKGQVDIVIGTHRILSKDVMFADLGLVIIDEEQRFGVEHKQRLLAFRTTADVLTLSATPIPRTLHMSLLGLRDISSLTTPPLERRAIVTEVIPYNAKRIKQAIIRELAREGQVFFVHNRVHNIQSVAAEIQELVPDAKIIVGHGQMPSRELEQVMLTFIRRKADILVCTTIIESGIDIPTANTMFINDANMFGLSELHQLRGRVGRYKHRAYCYMLLPRKKPPTDDAMRRLRAIENFSMLGAGFKIALRDLEIRGAGNLLGPEQSGHIAAVGYEMYCQLLEQAVAELKNQRTVTTLDTTIDLDITGSLPKGYIPSDARRMDAYRRISRAKDLDELAQVERDLISAYGELPRRADRLLQLAEIRVLATLINIQSVTRHEDDIIFRTRDPKTLGNRMNQAKGTLRFVGQPDSSGLVEVYYRPPKSYLEPDSLLAILRKRLKEEVEHPTTV